MADGKCEASPEVAAGDEKDGVFSNSFCADCLIAGQEGPDPAQARRSPLSDPPAPSESQARVSGCTPVRARALFP